MLEEPIDDTKLHCYLPHHPVFKDSSTTTKVRVVFDASCKTASGYSLNDTLLVGPVVQQDLLSIVMRFWTHSIALVADIEKIFRQIRLHIEDQPFQRILWRTNPDAAVSTYELQTVTYGTASAPYLATRTLQQIAKDNRQCYHASVNSVTEDFYVDDFLSGASGIESAIRLRKEVSSMLSTAGLPLKKWASNAPEVLEDVPPDDLAILPYRNLQDDQAVSTLGLVWEPKSDVLRFKVQLPLPAPVLTKRKVLSYIAQIFDPLGIVGPTIAMAKLFMQHLWALKRNGESCEWDTPLPPKLQAEWKQFHTTLLMIGEVRVPRFVSVPEANNIQLHFFSDASERAYGTCCYVRTESAGIVSVQLLAFRSKVSPLATRHTIARLELCAAELSVKLYKKINTAVKLSSIAYFWTDSTTVLQWLRGPPTRWKTFVANRVSKMQLSTDTESWCHVFGVENPTDDLSRGLNPIDLLNRTRWWTGPPFLLLPQERWPKSPLLEGESADVAAERRKVPLVAMTTTTTQLLQLAVCTILQLYKTTPAPPLTTRELEHAELSLCHLAQAEIFAREISDLTAGERVAKSSVLKWLNPFIDSDRILRVGGRLRHAALSNDKRHPIVLSAKHPLSALLASHFHLKLLHAGPQFLLATLRQKFWILGGRNLVKSVSHHCHTCFRSKPTLVQQSTADLPQLRVSPTRPFSVCGVDYCGPFFLKSAVRNRGPTKVYVAIFVCFSTKAVHIELVSDLSTPAFLAALRRLVARRGKISELHSDNATAFKGASNALNSVCRMLKVDEDDRNQIFNWCSENEIT
ncbi:uncharacterized protein LOC129719871 [Wyeomyia smithii]|uniref:uncharacterized protein LOC129719871 n=1 Tax=Wyeomyia smithii TaxID=174621 RepID=UPI002467D098|nr:uncharacterized protein LOC129719871 [Wyeomyia smithii]